MNKGIFLSISFFKKLFSHIRIQLFIVILIIVLYILSYHSIIPPFDELTAGLTNLFNNNGIFIVFIFSFLENIIGFGAYFPGSIVILTAMSLTHGDPTRAILVFLFIYFPSVIAHIINFFIGKKLTSHLSIRKDRKIWILFLTTMWHPHFAATTSSLMGSKKVSFQTFFQYLILFGLPWNIFWGVTMYNIGKFTESNEKLIEIIFYAYLFIWIVWDTIQFTKNECCSTKTKPNNFD